MKNQIRLGDKVKCIYTGFTGIVMAKTEYINGCWQYLVAEKYDKKKASTEIPTIEMSIDEQSLVIVDKKMRKPTKEEIEIAKETMDELEDEEETGGPHRKGATLASEGTIGIIPGSQGTTSYIIKGLGNRESFNSCSHGAGRKMGRKQAQRELNLENEQKMLNDKGILHSIRGSRDLDEASGAYKDIETVMNNQKDLVEVTIKLELLGVVKG